MHGMPNADSEKDNLKIAQVSVDDSVEYYRLMLHDAVIRNLLLGNADIKRLAPSKFHLDASAYQVAVCEEHPVNDGDVTCRFSDFMRELNFEDRTYDIVSLDSQGVVLLKGKSAIRKFHEAVTRYQDEQHLQEDSSPEHFLIACGKDVSSLADIFHSYQEARLLLSRRFFWQEGQYVADFNSTPPHMPKNPPAAGKPLMEEYVTSLLNYIQSFNRDAISETMQELYLKLCASSHSVYYTRLFLADIFLQIKERMNFLYSNSSIPFPSNSEIIRTIEEKLFLYEILRFLTEQIEVIMSSIGNYTRESVLDNILRYINHNYANNITLENIAPLFGYNSSYLGKIFNNHMGQNFNSYVDHIRIEKSKELLLKGNMKVYNIAESVGYKNVDYFHIKFKKYVGLSPMEFRKKNQLS